MICQTCKDEGKTSKVFPGMSTSTCMHYTNCQFYDEEGRYHDHQPSQMIVAYTCSNGHVWDEKLTKKCFNCEWVG